VHEISAVLKIKVVVVQPFFIVYFIWLLTDLKENQFRTEYG
jgi:hypothetical protein